MRIAAVVLIVGCGRIDFGPIGPEAVQDASAPPDTMPVDGQPACNALPITIRDFTSMHPDFNQMASGIMSGMVAPQLGADRTPVYVGGSSTTGPDDFRDWFHDTSANRRIASVLPYTPGEPARFGAEVFLPIDGQGFADTAIGIDGLPHNFRFTVELHARFAAAPGQTISVASDDDSWTFVDHQLAIDLGGVHGEATDLYDASSLAPGDHDLDVFYAEREEPGATLRIETTIACLRSN